MATAGASSEPEGPERFLREDGRHLHPYVPGTQPEGQGWIKLNTNENPYPPAPTVMAAIADELARDGERLRLYPHPAAAELKARAAKVYGVKPEQVFVGNGSDDVLRQLVRAVVPDEGAIAAAAPGYGLYRVLAEAHRARFVPVPYRQIEGAFALPDASAWPRAQLNFLTNPNSPTGVAAPVADVARLADGLDGLLVVDEAYADFADGDCLSLLRERDDVVVCRTFSKSYALAGLRLGLGLGPAPIVAALDALKDAYNVNRVALAAGAAALADQEALTDRVAQIVATRERVAAALRARGLFVFPSQANFLLVRVGDRANQLHQQLASERILVRYLGDMPDCLRISIGTDEEMDRLLGAIAAHVTASD